jgi:hypothetical protein
MKAGAKRIILFLWLVIAAAFQLLFSAPIASSSNASYLNNTGHEILPLSTQTRHPDSTQLPERQQESPPPLVRSAADDVLAPESEISSNLSVVPRGYQGGPGAMWVGEDLSVNPYAGTSMPVVANEVTTYQDFVDRSLVGDGLEGHELWQQANLNEYGLSDTRLSTPASQQKPVIALPREIHLDINAAQSVIDSRSMTPVENINFNADMLRHSMLPHLS